MTPELRLRALALAARYTPNATDMEPQWRDDIAMLASINSVSKLTGFDTLLDYEQLLYRYADIRYGIGSRHLARGSRRCQLPALLIDRSRSGARLVISELTLSYAAADCGLDESV